MTEQGSDRQKRPSDRLPDQPDLRDPTNEFPHLTGQRSTTGLGGVGGESAGGGVGPDPAGGAVPEAITRKGPGMSNAGSPAGASDPSARAHGAPARSVGGTGTAGPGSDVTAGDADAEK